MNELIDRLGRDPSMLADRILKAFTAVVLGNYYTFHPSQLPKVSRREAEEFLSFLTSPQEKPARELGKARAREGLGLASVLALGRILRQSCLEVSHFDGVSPVGEAIATADRFMDAYIAGYFEGREADLLQEQERTRKAYFASLYGHAEGSSGPG